GGKRRRRRPRQPDPRVGRTAPGSSGRASSAALGMSTPSRASTPRIDAAATSPITPYAADAVRQPTASAANATAAGTATLPRSPEKLYVPSAARRRPVSYAFDPPHH